MLYWRGKIKSCQNFGVKFGQMYEIRICRSRKCPCTRNALHKTVSVQLTPYPSRNKKAGVPRLDTCAGEKGDGNDRGAPMDRRQTNERWQICR